MDWQSLYVVDFFMQIGAFETTEGIVNNVWLISWSCPASDAVAEFLIAVPPH